MDIALIVLISVLASAFALGFYLDWFGLWATPRERQQHLDRSQARARELEKAIAK